MLVKACALLVLVAVVTAEPLADSDKINVAYTKMQANAKIEEKRNLLLGREQEIAPAEVLLEEYPKIAEPSFAKVPSWVSTEDDLEEFLQDEKKKGTNIVRTGVRAEKQQGSTPTETEMALIQEPAEETSLLQYTKFPSWVETEDDMEAYFKQQHTKVLRKDSGNGGVNPSGRKFVVDVQPKKSVEAEEAPISLLEDAATEGSKPQPAVKDRMQRLAKLNKRMATAGANKLIEELNNY